MPLLAGKQQHGLSLEGVNINGRSSCSLIMQSSLRLSPRGSLKGWWRTAPFLSPSLKSHPQVRKWQSWLKSKAAHSSLLVHFLIFVGFQKAATPTSSPNVQHTLVTNWGVLSEVGPDASGFLGVFGEKKDENIEAAASFVHIPEQKDIWVLRASHQGRKIPVQQEGGWQCSAASGLMQGWGETAAASATADRTRAPQAAVRQPLLAGTLGRGLAALFSLWSLGRLCSSCGFRRPS